MAKPCMLLWGQNKRTKRIQGKDFDFNRVPYTFYVRRDGATYFLVNRDKQFFFFFYCDSRLMILRSFHVHVNEFF